MINALSNIVNLALPYMKIYSNFKNIFTSTFKSRIAKKFTMALTIIVHRISLKVCPGWLLLQPEIIPVEPDLGNSSVGTAVAKSQKSPHINFLEYKGV